MDSYSESAHQGLIRQRLLERSKGYTPFELVGHETVPGLFDLQVNLRPDKRAIVSEQDALSYGELADASRRVADAMVRYESLTQLPVAVLVSQPAHFAMCVLGILRAGGFYLALDAAFPESRNQMVLSDSGARLVISDVANASIAKRVAGPGREVLLLEDLGSPHAELSDRGDAGGLAYIISTSGSTGRPKGVVQTQRNVLEVIHRYTNALCLGSEDQTSLLTSFSVTASVAPLLSSLLNGATLHTFSVLERGLQALAEWLDAEEITVYHSVPSLFRHLMKSVAPRRRFKSVRAVHLTGDSTYKSDWELFTQHFDSEVVLVNCYGCSEMSSVAKFYMDARSRLTDSVVPVGYPMSGVEISVVCADGLEHEVQPAALTGDSMTPPGEIVLKSRYLSPGYWTEASLPDGAASLAALAGEVRTYPTGDLGTIRHDRGLAHVGRIDLQVKLSGYRVEIAEVEGHLREFPGVREAAAAVCQAEHGERELLAFVECHAEPPVSTATIRSFLQSRLPGHMVPAEIVLVDRMPTTPNRKIDRAALLEQAAANRRSKARESAASAMEERLVGIWREVMNRAEIGVEDDFFECGGTSVLALSIAANVSRVFSIGAPVLELFEYSTVRRMARFIEEKTANTQADSEDLLEEGSL
jgi:acyl-coenzyme A synthetase/AMP-(fatty) acid ligase